MAPWAGAGRARRSPRGMVGDEARLVECRVCGGRMMWKILPGEGRVPPVRRHTSPPRWKMYDGSVSRSPARRESFLMGKTPRKKLFPVNRPKSGAPLCSAFAPQGKQRRTRTPAAPHARQGKAADARKPQPPFPRVRCVFATGWHAAAREQQTHTSSPGTARTLPRRGKQRRPQAPIPNFPISKSPSPQAPDPQIYLKFPSSKFRFPKAAPAPPKAPSPRPQNAAGGRPLLVDLPPSVPARSLHSE